MKGGVVEFDGALGERVEEGGVWDGEGAFEAVDGDG